MLFKEELLNKAQALNSDKKYLEVVELLSDELLKKHNDADLYSERAEAHYSLKQNDLCGKLIDVVLNINPSHAKANYYKGIFYYFDKQYNNAIECFKKAIDVNPEYVKSYHGLGKVYLALKEYEKAKDYYIKATEIDPKSESSFVGIAEVFFYLGKFKESMFYCNKALELNSSSAKAHYQFGKIYYFLGEPHKAIENFLKAADIEPDFSGHFNGLGIVYNQLHEYDKSIQYFNKAIEIDSQSANPYKGLGDVFANLENYEESIKFYKKAIFRDANFASAYYGLASIYYYNNNLKDALDNYRIYIDLTKNESDYFTLQSKSKIEEIVKIINDSDYGQINKLVTDIKKLLLFEDGLISHYTSLSTAKSLIIDESKFRLSECTFLNDSSEGKELFDFLDIPKLSISYDEKSNIKPFIQKPFIGSFVSNLKSDDLTLWRMYGKDNKEEAKGCSITIDCNRLQKNLLDALMPQIDSYEKIDDDFMFYHMVYRTKDSKKLFIVPGAKKNEKKLNVYMNELSQKVKDYINKSEKDSDEIIKLQEFHDALSKKMPKEIKDGKEFRLVVKKIEDTKKRIEDNRQNIDELYGLLNSIAFLFKSIEYQYEQEIRMVVKGIGFEKIVKCDNLPIVYIETVPINSVIKKITLGPKVELSDEWATAFYYKLDKQDYHPDIHISHLPFK